MRRVGSILVVISWLVFIASWAMPVVQFQDMEPYMGWMAGWAVIKKIPDFYMDWQSFFASILGVGNIVVAIAPAALFFPVKRLLKVLSLFFVAVFFIALSVFFDSGGYAEGYFLWVVSFLGVAIGLSMISSALPHKNV